MSENDYIEIEKYQRVMAKLEIAEKALKTIAEYDGESIWSDDRDDAANQMLDIANNAYNEITK